MAANAKQSAPQVVQVNADKVYVKALEILKNENIGSLRNMFAKYIMRGKDFVFKTPERIIPSHYQAIGGNKTQYGEVGEVTITADQSDIIKYPIETLDWATQVLADEEIAQISGSMVTAIDAQLDAEILTKLVAAAKTNIEYMGADPSAGAGKSWISEDSTDAEILKVWRKMSFYGNRMIQKVTKTSVGAPRGQFFYLVSLDTLTLLVEALRTYTTKGLETFVEGSDVVGFKVGNITCVAHNYLGMTFPAGSIHEKKAYDFAGIDILPMHSESFGFVFNHAPTFEQAVDPDTFNRVIGVKYQFGSGVLRPAYIGEISAYKSVTEAGAATATSTAEVVSADILTTAPNTKA